ncbi:hypothetical protein C0J52_24599 [Blattella germanica]|nr:hypothetical protein C0J52_24599 [Blattella germanica]
MTNQDDNITLLSPCMFPGVENTNREQVSSATWGQVVPRYNGDAAFDKRMDINVPRTWTNSISFASGNSSLTSSRGEWRTPEEGVIDSENVWSDSFLMDDDRSSSWSDSPPSKRSVKVRSGRSKKSRRETCEQSEDLTQGHRIYKSTAGPANEDK